MERLEHQDLPVKSFRTYHPRYLWAGKKSVRRSLALRIAITDRLTRRFSRRPTRYAVCPRLSLVVMRPPEMTTDTLDGGENRV